MEYDHSAWRKSSAPGAATPTSARQAPAAPAGLTVALLVRRGGLYTDKVHRVRAQARYNADAPLTGARRRSPRSEMQECATDGDGDGDPGGSTASDRRRRRPVDHA